MRFCDLLCSIDNSLLCFFCMIILFHIDIYFELLYIRFEMSRVKRGARIVLRTQMAQIAMIAQMNYFDFC